MDDVLKSKGRPDYLSRIESKCDGYPVEKFHLKKRTFGTIAIISGLVDKAPEEIRMVKIDGQ